MMLALRCSRSDYLWDAYIPSQSAQFQAQLHNFRSDILLMYLGGQKMVAQALESLLPVWEKLVTHTADL